MTIRHKINEESPFFLKRDAPDEVQPVDGAEAPPPPPPAGKVYSTLDGIAHLSCSLVATDAFGIPITEVQQYSPDTGFMGSLSSPTFITVTFEARCREKPADRAPAARSLVSPPLNPSGRQRARPGRAHFRALDDRPGLGGVVLVTAFVLEEFFWARTVLPTSV